jgi:hypothetical protein
MADAVPMGADNPNGLTDEQREELDIGLAPDK